MRSDKDERELMRLSQILTNWDKVDANQVINDLNDFFYLLEKHNYEPESFGVTANTFPTAYIPKLLKESKLVIATDKNGQCIFGNEPPYLVKPVDVIKKTIKNLR